MITAAEVKQHVVPLEFYGRALQGWCPRRERGWVDGGICPFHDDRRAGSFKVSLDTGAFRCFSCGASGGDIFAFVMLRDGVGFRTALGLLTESWSLS